MRTLESWLWLAGAVQLLILFQYSPSEDSALPQKHGASVADDSRAVHRALGIYRAGAGDFCDVLFRLHAGAGGSVAIGAIPLGVHGDFLAGACRCSFSSMTHRRGG